MQQSETKFPNFAGTPEGYRRVGFRYPTGRAIVALVKMATDWDVSVFVEAETNCVFCIGSSPDKQGLSALRWLSGHAERRLDWNTAAEQQAALGGKSAATAVHEELVEAAKAALTDGDDPQPVQTPPLQLVDAVIRPDDKKGQWDFHFRQTREETPRTVAQCRLSPPMGMVTKADPANLVKAFRNGASQMYFLFDEGAEFLLECIRMHGYRIQRVEARSAKAIHAGETPQQTVEAMASSLA